MNFPRYFDVTLPDERYPALVEVATDRQVEIWDPLGWKWDARLPAGADWTEVSYLVDFGWIAVGHSETIASVAYSSDGITWTTTPPVARTTRLRRWLSEALRPSALGF